TQAEGSLREGIQLAFSLAKSRPDVEVVVFSDGGGEDLSTLPTGGAAVRYVQVGTKSINSGIIALDLRRSPASDLEHQLFVTVQNFGRKPVDGSVEVYLANQLVGVRAEALPDDTPVSMVFDLPANARGKLQVNLSAAEDLLQADDVAYAILSSSASRKVLLVGGDKLTARALGADPRVKLSIVTPGQVNRALLEQFDAIVFGGAVPDDVDGLSYLVLAPQHGGPVTFGESLVAPKVVGWRRTHPVLRFVNFDGVTVAKTSQVVDGAGLMPLVDGDRGPLILAGERYGGRVVQLAFDPFHSDMPLRVAWPVMMLNSVSWMTERVSGDGGNVLIPTGTIWARKIPQNIALADVRVVGPQGREPVAQLSEGFLRVSDTALVGFYEVRIGDGTASFAANLLSQRESNIAPRGVLGLASGEERVDVATMAAGRRELWRPLLLFALLILLVEWLVWNRRKVA
ncbi:MAG: hypothetical protein HN348_20285, partial [Proteobacteria bacterium]|nr:hypothetical protein [Pseudomonadota bacterium]